MSIKNRKINFKHIIKTLNENVPTNSKTIRFYQFFKEHDEKEYTGERWAEMLEEFTNTKIIDIDGWRMNDNCDYRETKICASEFHERLMMCTIGG